VKYVVFSDVHGNLIALNQMFRDTKNLIGLGGYICCGDLSGYYYHTDGVIEKLLSVKQMLVVKGNHDQAVVDSGREVGKLTKLALKYGNSYLKFEKLKDSYYHYLSNLPDKLDFVANNKRIGVYHGTPGDALSGRFYPNSFIGKDALCQYDVLFLGHTHYRVSKYQDGTMIVNPGSLGQPRDGNGFSYCVFDLSKMECVFKTVSINIEEILREINENEANIAHKSYLTEVLNRKNNY
jgi:putative phosphoesterase